MEYVSTESRKNLTFLMIYLVALLFALTVNGALPFFTCPTLGQAVWMTGFSQSFLNESLSTIYSHNIGAPEPAAIAFGLAGAYVTAVFMALGMHAVDAYTSMIALWLAVAFFSAYRLCRFFSVTQYLAVLAALTWCTMPMIYKHAGFSVLSMGIALLPLYLFASLKLFNKKFATDSLTYIDILKSFLFYLFICLLAIFMDGYTFMMFACGASVIALFTFMKDRNSIRQNFYRLSIHILSFGLAYFAYALYLGKPQFETVPLDFFRGWGVDITFWLIPTTGVHWLLDLLGLSNSRSGKLFFGDSSVWVTTFALPLIIGALAAVFINKKTSHKLPLILITVFGFYMALGPSFKFNSIKPAEYSGGELMEETYAIAPTGTTILSERLPGFKNMRASYRWQALGVFGAWALIMIGMSRHQSRRVLVISSAFLSLVLLLNLPDMPKKLVKDIKYRSMFYDIDQQLLSELNKQLQTNEKVAFLPWRNDFLVNYLAANLGIRTFNIGGDKNYQEARLHWPELLQQFQMAKIDSNFAERVALVLARKDTDVVILPYIDLLWAAHDWPAKAQYKKDLEPVENKLATYDWLNIEFRDYYSIIRLKPEVDDLDKKIHTMMNENCGISSFCIDKTEFYPEETLTQVGVFENGKLFSHGKEGFLTYGPYKSLEAGSYTLQIEGEIAKATDGWIDVVSNHGEAIHFRILLSEIKEKKIDNSSILTHKIVLDKPVTNVEIRVYVTEQDSLFIESYTLRKVK